MNAAPKLFLAIAVLGAIAVASLMLGYHRMYPTYAIRYRLDVRATSGGVPRSGSSVIEVRVEMQPKLLDSPLWSFSMDGDATFIDLGEGRNLVSLLNPGPTEGKGLDAVSIVFRAYQIPFQSDHAADIAKLTGERELPPADWPPFVSFRDVHDALTVERVDPGSLQDTYGVETRIDRVSVTITREPVTRGLERDLPWLTNVPQSPGDPKAIAMLRKHLGKSAFIERFRDGQ